MGGTRCLRRCQCVSVAVSPVGCAGAAITDGCSLWMPGFGIGCSRLCGLSARPVVICQLGLKKELLQPAAKCSISKLFPQLTAGTSSEPLADLRTLE